MFHSSGVRVFFLGLFIKLIFWSTRTIFRLIYLPLGLAVKAPWYVISFACKIVMLTVRYQSRQRHKHRQKMAVKLRQNMEKLAEPQRRILPDGSQHVWQRQIVVLGERTFIRKNLKVIPSPLSPLKQTQGYQLASYYRDFPVKMNAPSLS